MSAMLCTIFFLGAAALAIGTIVHGAMGLGPQVSIIRQQARCAPDMKEYKITVFAIPSSLQMAEQPLPKVRRNGTRAATRPVVRRNEQPRVAA